MFVSFGYKVLESLYHEADQWPVALTDSPLFCEQPYKDSSLPPPPSQPRILMTCFLSSTKSTVFLNRSREVNSLLAGFRTKCLLQSVVFVKAHFCSEAKKCYSKCYHCLIQGEGLGQKEEKDYWFLVILKYLLTMLSFSSQFLSKLLSEFSSYKRFGFYISCSKTTWLLTTYKINSLFSNGNCHNLASAKI